MNISILYGTETGNAEMLAEDIQSELEGDHDVSCQNLSDVDPMSLVPEHLYLLVCSTYGDGELPASAQPFAEAMEAAKPDLSAIHFAIFGMGDSEYDETFNHGPKRLAELMLAHGATQIGERVAHDASGPEMAEDLAFPWAEEIISQAEERLGAAA
ncbi:flavodoxin domain-containing protein [Maritimibacter sp. UBA3975]|uniref:flavodoxin domain-containing protein n=1 Tax=Maritimibacter sp. UBA3975 TaxID=1946833 RepID=UPI000C090A3F|nr:flavodoxin domain-containing protein [Maritimibacter sp. UBA3975]MAM63177.1 nitric oxide synthase [Maritimibacter sp.]|tara:strand:+ start:27201 stop:27668 length:468 start_codon:yes stop_codon:yes gene_type:complete